MFSFVKDKQFLKKAILIALPITLQNLLSTSTNFIDTLMVATLDATSVASVGLGNKIFYDDTWKSICWCKKIRWI